MAEQPTNANYVEFNTRTQNLNTIGKNVNILRTTQNTKGFNELLWQPDSLNPMIKDRTVLFELNERKDGQYENAIYATTTRDPNNKNSIRALVEFNTDPNKSLLNLFEGAKRYNLQGAIQDVQNHITTLYKGLPNELKSDRSLQESFLSTSKLLERNFNDIVKRGDFTFQKSDEQVLLQFILAHELAHLSFKDKDEIQFKYADKVKLPQSSQAQKYLSNAILNVNRYMQDDSIQMQHEGANYSSSRDEIHSDIAGMFTATFLALKNKTASEQDLRRIFTQLGILRDNMNDVNIHKVSTHTTGDLFKPNNIDRVINMAKQQLQNPQMDSYAAVLDMTEDVFLNMIKDKGIIIKRAFQLDNNIVKQINDGSGNVNSLSTYVESMGGSNQSSRQEFEKCVSKMKQSNLTDSCLYYLNGAQKTAIDPDKDKKLNTTNLSSALISASKNGTLPGASGKTPNEIERSVSILESEALTTFAELNNIKIKTTNDMGADIIELNRNSASVKFK